MVESTVVCAELSVAAAVASGMVAAAAVGSSVTVGIFGLSSTSTEALRGAMAAAVIDASITLRGASTAAR